MEQTVLRDEIYAAAHRWPVIVASFIIGSLIGIFVAIVWPSPYRATLELGVELSLYRATEDDYIAEIAKLPFRNADDYKYWQMQQLNALVFSDEYLGETLSRLKETDIYWQEFTVQELRDMFQVYWRNAGRWRLAAEVSRSHNAKQAVETWRDVILEKTNGSITDARKIYLIDLQLQRTEDALLESKIRQAQLAEIKAVLLDWREKIQGTDGTGVLDPSQRWWLISLASQAAGVNLGWRSLLDSIPSPGASMEEYIPWVEKIIIHMEAESEAIATQIDELDRQSEILQSEWELALQDSDGLAATLVVEKLSDMEPRLSQVRPNFIAALVGGMFGLLLWGAITLIDIYRRSEK